MPRDSLALMIGGLTFVAIGVANVALGRVLWGRPTNRAVREAATRRPRVYGLAVASFGLLLVTIGMAEALGWMPAR